MKENAWAGGKIIGTPSPWNFVCTEHEVSRWTAAPNVVFVHVERTITWTNEKTGDTNVEVPRQCILVHIAGMALRRLMPRRFLHLQDGDCPQTLMAILAGAKPVRDDRGRLLGFRVPEAWVKPTTTEDSPSAAL